MKPATRARFLDLRDSFIRDHFCKWVPELADTMDKATTEPFFRAIARVLKGNPGEHIGHIR